MLFWILIAFLTGAAALTVLVPASRARKAREREVMSADEAVYREQLSAIDSELDRGLIDAEAAKAARTEVGRRLLAAHDRQGSAAEAEVGQGRVKFVQAIAVVALPLLAVGIYLVLGSPDLPDAPLAARMNAPADEQSVDVLVARVERHLSENPQDGQGWAVVAPVYLSLERPQDAAAAYANAIRLLGPRADWYADMGEALTVSERGLVTAAAQGAFEKALDLDADAVKPRFFLAIALAQEGKTGEAIAAWNRLLEGADENAAWVQAARRQLAELETPRAASQAQPGPTRDQVEASQEMSPEDRQAMISDMVGRLADRLASDGGTAMEWTRLIRAYMVMGDREKAENALVEAMDEYADKPGDLSLIKDAANELGLSGS
ncbi:c-type cytochrome biogenesis protein CcmI [Rhodobacterales bacterium]|nr:c-type cytochrome biogenesis protein CcmI [Rhodobacterales bacterium]